MPEPTGNSFDGQSLARRLLRSVRTVTLATLASSDGFPLATLTTIATNCIGEPVLLLSQLSLHTRNLDADPRCSLLLAQGGKGDPLAHPRLSLVGRAVRVSEPVQRRELRARFLNRNPKAALYADFADFSFWRLALQEAHLNGGFGKAAGYQGLDLLSAVMPGLAEAEAGLLERLNGAGAKLRARVVAEGGADVAWRASGVDAEGVDLLAGEAVWRLQFGQGCQNAADLARQVEALCAAA